TPPGFIPKAGLDDDPEMVLVAAPEIDESIEGLMIGIRYVDSRGDCSDRVVECYGLAASAAGDVTLRGLCHVRDAVRCFRLDRIRELTDYRTGEIHQDPRRIL